jgi:NAD(P)H-dependent flavin oxidoreductase YrpB (nitropropane dioxygenase family)
MNAVSHGPLVAAVTNAGGLGVLGGLTMSIATRHATLSNGDSACYADLGSTKDAAAADRRREGQPDLADRKVRRRSRHSAGWKLHVQTPQGVARSRDRARWEEMRAKRTTTTRMAERTHLPTDHRLSAPNTRRARVAARPLPMHQSRNLPRSHDLPELADIIISEGAPRSYRI